MIQIVIAVFHLRGYSYHSVLDVFLDVLPKTYECSTSHVGLILVNSAQNESVVQAVSSNEKWLLRIDRWFLKHIHVYIELAVVFANDDF